MTDKNVQVVFAPSQYTVNLTTELYMLQNSSVTSAFCSLICNIQGKRLKRNNVYYSICMFIRCNIILHSFRFYTSQTSQNSITRITTPKTAQPP